MSNNPYHLPESNEPNTSPYASPASSYNAYPQQEPKRGLLGTDFSFQKTVVPNADASGYPIFQQKSSATAYALWFFLGWLGVHQFYLGNTPRALFHIGLWAATLILGLIGIPLGIVYFAYWVYDAVVLAEQVREVNAGYLRKSVL